MEEAAALEFVRHVKSTFSPTNGIDNKCGQFVLALKMFHKGIINRKAAIDMLNILFKEHQLLHSEFNKILNHIPIAAVAAAKVGTDLSSQSPIEECRGFLNIVKDRFMGNNNDYLKFLKILDRYSNGLAVSEVYAQICVLSYGHIDLISEFEEFLKGSGKSEQEITAFRQFAMEDCLYNLDVISSQFRVVIRRMKENPNPTEGKITGWDIKNLERICLAPYKDDGLDLYHDLLKNLMEQIKEHPNGVSKDSIRDLEQKEKDVREKCLAMRVEFFKQVLALPLVSMQ